MRTWRFLLLAIALVVAGPVVAQDDHAHGEGDGHDHDQAGGDMEAQMQAYLEMAKPVAEHEFLTKLVGTWKAEGKFWMAAGAPPSETTGTSVNEMILGGRFLESRYDGPSPMGGGEFVGVAVDGFDRMANKYVGTWIDTFQTMIVSYEGTVDASGKVRTMVAEYPNPMGGTAKSKGVTTLINDRQFKYEGFNITPEGEQKQMEILYTRQ